MLGCAPGFLNWRGWLWICLSILLAGVAWVVFSPEGSDKTIVVNLTPVAEVQTNGEHWLIFRFDAPKSRAVIIQQVLTMGGDRYPDVLNTRAESFPDPTLPPYGLVRAGSSRLLKVRRVAGGDWQVRAYLLVPLRFGKQWLERIKSSWRSKSFKHLDRIYLERGSRYVESEFVKTSETVVAAPPRTVPSWSAAVSTSDFFRFPLTPDVDAATGEKIP